jgi:hypothetical protein
MSHIQAKIARRAVRQIGKHPREVVVQLGKQVFIPPFPGAPGAIFLGQHRLSATCGRAIYRALKKADRKGLVPAI